jgi:hypothetical protein
MKSLEFKGTVAPEGQIILPPDVAQQVPRGEQVQVVLLWETNKEDDGWSNQGRERFEAAFAPEDAVYEQLVNEPPAR